MLAPCRSLGQHRGRGRALDVLERRDPGECFAEGVAVAAPAKRCIDDRPSGVGDLGGRETSELGICSAAERIAVVLLRRRLGRTDPGEPLTHEI